MVWVHSSQTCTRELEVASVAVLEAASWSIRNELALLCLELLVEVSAAEPPALALPSEALEVLRCTVGPRSLGLQFHARCFSRCLVLFPEVLVASRAF